MDIFTNKPAEGNSVFRLSGADHTPLRSSFLLNTSIGFVFEVPCLNRNYVQNQLTETILRFSAPSSNGSRKKRDAL